jgi:hypothetical protein
MFLAWFEHVIRKWCPLPLNLGLWFWPALVESIEFNRQTFCLSQIIISCFIQRLNAVIVVISLNQSNFVPEIGLHMSRNKLNSELNRTELIRTRFEIETNWNRAELIWILIKIEFYTNYELNYYKFYTYFYIIINN